MLYSFLEEFKGKERYDKTKKKAAHNLPLEIVEGRGKGSISGQGGQGFSCAFAVSLCLCRLRCAALVALLSM